MKQAKIEREREFAEVGSFGPYLMLSFPKGQPTSCSRRHRFWATPSVTFVFSFFGRSPLHKRKGIPLPQGGAEGLFRRKTTLVWALYGHWTSVIFVRARRRVPMGLSSTHKSAPAQGQQLQLKSTSDVMSVQCWSCRVSAWRSGNGALDVRFRVSRDEGGGCRCRPVWFSGTHTIRDKIIADRHKLFWN